MYHIASYMSYQNVWSLSYGVPVPLPLFGYATEGARRVTEDDRGLSTWCRGVPSTDSSGVRRKIPRRTDRRCRRDRDSAWSIQSQSVDVWRPSILVTTTTTRHLHGCCCCCCGRLSREIRRDRTLIPFNVLLIASFRRCSLAQRFTLTLLGLSVIGKTTTLTYQIVNHWRRACINSRMLYSTIFYSVYSLECGSVNRCF